MKKLIFVIVIYAICVLYYVFGASTNVNISSPSNVSNIVNTILSGPLVYIGRTNTNSPTYLTFKSGVSGNTEIGRLRFNALSSGIDTNYAYINVLKQASGGSVMQFFVTLTNGSISGLMTIDQYGNVNVAKLSMLGLVFTGDGSVVAMPLTNGTAGQVLKSNGSNALYWAAP